MKIRHIVLSGLFAAITAALSQVMISIPVSPVPITLQVFSVALAGAVLGGRLGALSQLVYIIVGAAGLPVFAGFEAGIGVILGPRGGYILGFPVLAFIPGFFIERQTGLSVYSFCAGGTGVFYIGTAWLGIMWAGYHRGDYCRRAGFPIDALVLASVITLQIRRRLRISTFQRQTRKQPHAQG